MKISTKDCKSSESISRFSGRTPHKAHQRTDASNQQMKLTKTDKNSWEHAKYRRLPTPAIITNAVPGLHTVKSFVLRQLELTRKLGKAYTSSGVDKERGAQKYYIFKSGLRSLKVTLPF